MSTKSKLGLLIWGAGLIGVVAMTGVLPRLLATLPEVLGREMPPLPFPMWVLVLLSLAQSSTLLALAVWGGVALSPAVGLRAPAFEAAVSRQSILRALRPQLVPGVVAGILGGGVLIAFWRFAPPQIQAVQDRIAVPLIARVLYGGITEELLLRWGFMTLVVWLGWRVFARTSTWVWVAIVVSALVFGLGHLPAASLFVGPLNATVIAYVIAGNALFGILFGYLFWRYGLEAAILAHALTHVVSYLASSLSRA